MVSGWARRLGSHTVGMHPMVPMPIVTYSLQRGLARAPPRPQIRHIYEVIREAPREPVEKNHRPIGG
jgi:hypothetical protein